MERQHEAQDGIQGQPRGDGGPRRFVRDRIPRGLWIRVVLYGLVGHVFAAFLLLLFQLGE
ncbi:DUF6126 family protein [Streptomyces avicenniae]|uniref:DUF6126 family protein n=1 Tax=Streptomyces avicenniae TaxID=500153 RepID=UPI00069C846B|nr:DUF6126 family protein [Streptomyces avicenniae]